MKLLPWVGILCILVGAFALFKGIPYTAQKNVVQVGEFKAAVEEKKAIPAWAGVLVIVAGAGMILIGGRKRP
jgi:hypothetical protein